MSVKMCMGYGSVADFISQLPTGYGSYEILACSTKFLLQAANKVLLYRLMPSSMVLKDMLLFARYVTTIMFYLL